LDQGEEPGQPGDAASAGGVCRRSGWRLELAEIQTVADDRVMPLRDHEKRKAYQRAWAVAKRAKNPEPSRIARRKYRAKNLDMVRKKDRQRRKRAKAEEP